MTTRTNHLLAAFLRLPLDSDNEHICQGGRYMEERSELDKLDPVFPYSRQQIDSCSAFSHILIRAFNKKNQKNQ